MCFPRCHPGQRAPVRGMAANKIDSFFAKKPKTRSIPTLNQLTHELTLRWRKQQRVRWQLRQSDGQPRTHHSSRTAEKRSPWTVAALVCGCRSMATRQRMVFPASVCSFISSSTMFRITRGDPPPRPLVGKPKPLQQRSNLAVHVRLLV